MPQCELCAGLPTPYAPPARAGAGPARLATAERSQANTDDRRRRTSVAYASAKRVIHGTLRTIVPLLAATNNLTDLPDNQSGFAFIYDQNGDGTISSSEAQLRTKANEIFTFINEAGHV